MKKKRIALLHPCFALGGASAITFWIIESLKETCDIDLIVTENIPDLSRLNDFFGTRLEKNDFRIIRLMHVPGFYLRSKRAESYYRKHRKQYRFAIASNHEMDLGGQGIQYIHYPTFRKKPVPPAKILFRSLVNLVWGHSDERMKKNLTLTNSDWTKQWIRQAYGIDADVVYPPVRALPSLPPWEDRKNEFLCLGRFSPEKQFERAMEILEKVRTDYPEIALHLVGHVQNQNYYRKLEQERASRSPWVTLHPDLSSGKVRELLARCRYGIHAMPSEHFGIGIAEIARAGCIPFVPDTGGQVEIVEEDPHLTYGDPGEAVKKISRVLGDEHLQAGLREKLHAGTGRFSVERFQERIRGITSRFEQEQPARSH